MLFLSFLLMAGCASAVPAEQAKQPAEHLEATAAAPLTMHDTIYVATPGLMVCNYDSLIRKYDSMCVVSDTLGRRLLHARLVISNVRYYLNLAIKNPTQDKFLKGWIRRALQ